MKYARNPTKQEVKEIKAIIWKYFTPHVADQVLKGVGLRKGEPEAEWGIWCNCKETSRANCKAAADEYFDYLGKRGIGGIDEKYLTEEEMALVYYAGFIYPETGCPPRTGPDKRLMKILEEKDRQFKQWQRRNKR